MGWMAGNKEYLQTQFEILKSRELAARVVRDLKLEHLILSLLRRKRQSRKQIETSFKLDWRFLLPKGHEKIPSISDDEKFNRIVDRFLGKSYGSTSAQYAVGQNQL
jgi:succinoglycan biosynthesis transport protein ExoP